MNTEIVKDVYFYNSKEIASNEDWNPLVKYNVFIRSKEPFVFGGMRFVIPILEEYNAEYEVFYNDGDTVPAGTATLFTYTAPYIEVGEIEGHLIGMISETTRAIQRMIPLTEAAGDIPWLYFGARHRAPEVDVYWASAALLAGAAGIASVPTAQKLGVEARGTSPHALSLVGGDTLKTAIAYNRRFPDKPIIILPDTFGKEVTDTLAVLEHFGEELVGTRLDTNGGRFFEGCYEVETFPDFITVFNEDCIERYQGASVDPIAEPIIKRIKELLDNGDITMDEVEKYVIGKGVTIEASMRMRVALDNNGGAKVQLVLTSGFNPRKIYIFKLFGVPIDMLGIGVSDPFMATSDIVEKDGERCHKTGRYENDYTEDGKFVPVGVPE